MKTMACGLRVWRAPTELTRAANPGEVCGAVNPGEVCGARARFPARSPERTAAGVELGFYSDDVRAVHERVIAAAVPALHAPRMEPWRLTARYGDPDGNIVGITTR